MPSKSPLKFQNPLSTFNPWNLLSAPVEYIYSIKVSILCKMGILIIYAEMAKKQNQVTVWSSFGGWRLGMGGFARDGFGGEGLFLLIFLELSFRNWKHHFGDIVICTFRHTGWKNGLTKMLQFFSQGQEDPLKDCTPWSTFSAPYIVNKFPVKPLQLYKSQRHSMKFRHN